MANQSSDPFAISINQQQLAIRCSRSALLIAALRRRNSYTIGAVSGDCSNHLQEEEIDRWRQLAVAAKKAAMIEQSKMEKMELIAKGDVIVLVLLLVFFVAALFCKLFFTD